MVTTSPSEPLLAEAARKLWEKPWFNAPLSLLDHISHPSLDSGDRGEVVATLLLLLAADKVRGSNDNVFNDPVTKHKDDGSARVFQAFKFLSTLIRCTRTTGQLEGLLPSVYKVGDENVTLRDALKDYSMWFNHIVKVRSLACIQASHLWEYGCRGAAVLCASNQEGVDIVLPMFKAGRVGSAFVSAILIQVKNESIYSTVRPHLFDRMTPVDTLNASTEHPFIRLVFSFDVDSAEVGVHLRGPSSLPQAARSEYTAYDIWLSGAKSSTFGVIPSKASPEDASYTTELEKEENAYEKLLALARQPGNFFKHTVPTQIAVIH
ncbi:hypothetical protein EIP86_006283 [Pleurotus ostreatoroseus]|nr:hypothetical protein EIP86_006283 [Pleurotus ostreatoroseus]